MMNRSDNTQVIGRGSPRRPSRTVASIALAVAAVLLCTLAADAHGPFSAFGWGPAQPVDLHTGNVNTPALEGCPIESPDGHYLFMASNRADGKGLIDIWVSYRPGLRHAWGVPQNLPAPINTAVDDFCPTPLTGGRLMFVSRRPSACAPEGQTPTHIYQTRLDPALGWLPPEILPCEHPDDVNSLADELSPSVVEAGGRTILFFSSGRDGVQNIYTSELQSDGRWGPAVAVTELNTPFQDARPNVSHDGLEIVFDTTRDGGLPDIWAARRTSLSKPWSKPVKLGPNVNSDGPETRPSLSRDGRRLYFGSVRDGGKGASDIYVSTRHVAATKR